MLVSTERLQLLTGDKTLISSNTVEAVKRLLAENPEQVCLFEVLKCFGSTLYTSTISFTSKKGILDKIIQAFLNIPHKTLLEDFKKLNLKDEKKCNEWIKFCYFMKQEREFLVNNRKLLNILPKLNNILSRFSEAEVFTPENLKIITRFLKSSEYSLLETKSLEDISAAPLHFWLYYFGGGGKPYDDKSINHISKRYDDLPAGANLTEKATMLDSSLEIPDDQYEEMISFLEELKVDSHDPRFSFNLLEIQLFTAGIILQKAGCLSVLRQCLRINYLNQFIAIVPTIKVSPVIAQFSDENLHYLLSIEDYRFHDYANYSRPLEKKQIDLRSNLVFWTGDFKQVDWAKVYPETMHVECHPKDILRLLVHLQDHIMTSEKGSIKANPFLVLKRNNHISKFFPDYSPAAVIETLNFCLFMRDTSRFAVYLLLVNAGLDSYLDILRLGGYNLDVLLTLKEQGRLNPQTIRNISSRGGECSNFTNQLQSYREQNRTTQLFIQKNASWNEYVFKNARYMVYQCLEKLDESTKESIKNTLKLFASYGYRLSSKKTMVVLLAVLESFITTKASEPYIREGQKLNITLMAMILPLFSKKEVILNGGENFTTFCEELINQIILESPRLLVSSDEIIKTLPRTTGLSSTLRRLNALLEKGPLVSLVDVFFCFDKIIAQEKEGIKLTDKWVVLENLTKKYLGMTQDMLRSHLSSLGRGVSVDWIRICYLTRNVNDKGRSLSTFLIKNNLSAFYEILKILAAVEDLQNDNLLYLFQNLKTKKIEDLSNLSPALLTYYLEDYIFAQVDVQAIEKRYQTLPLASLKSKQKLLHLDNDTYEKLLSQWKQVKSDQRFPSFTPMEEKKCFEIFFHMAPSYRHSLLEQCLRLNYLKFFVQAFKADDIEENFSKFSDRNLIYFIELFLAHDYDNTLGHAQIAHMNSLVKCSCQPTIALDLINWLWKEPKQRRTFYFEEREHLSTFLRTLQAEMHFSEAVIHIEKALLAEKNSYNRVFLIVLRNSMIENFCPPDAKLLDLEKLIQKLGNKNLALSIFEIHLYLMAAQLLNFFKSMSLETLIDNHDLIRTEIKELYTNNLLDLEKVTAVLNRIDQREPVGQQTKIYAAALGPLLKNCRIPRKAAGDRNSLFAYTSHPLLTSEMMNEREEKLYPL